MSFVWPTAFLLTLFVPLLLGLYFWQLRRKRRMAVRFSSVALLRAAMPKRSRWRRVLPMALFLAGLGGLAVATARPQTSVTVPIGRTVIILALDVSRSMCATDVPPNRISVAQAAARTFVKDQPKGTRIGIVAFAGFAELVVEPSTDKQSLLKAIDGLATSRGTAIGAAMLKSIDAIAAVNPAVRPVHSESEAIAEAVPTSVPARAPAKAVIGPKGAYASDIVVVLTDGANTQGVEPLEAAKQAIDRGVRVYTIGFGTTNPTGLVCTAQQLGGDAFSSGFGGRGGGFPSGGGAFLGGGRGGNARPFLVIDEPTLKEVAAKTGGAYYRAKDAGQLRKVFAKLPKDVVLQRKHAEISSGFAAVGALLVGTAIMLSLRWNR